MSVPHYLSSVADLNAVEWNWGSAASSPMALYGDGGQNICNK